MRDFVGVKHLLGVPDTAYIKQEALMFHRIAIPAFRAMANLLRDGSCREMEDYFSDLDWLFEQGIIFEPYITSDELPLDDNEYLEYQTLELKHFEKTWELAELSKKTHETYCAHDLLYALQYHVRRTSLILRKSRQIEAYPILYHTVPVEPKTEATKNDVVEITLKTLPVPDYSTPWEQIIEYRSDQDSEDRFLDLRNWMSEIAQAKLPPLEVEQKLEYLMSQYQRHMKLHRMKVNAGVLETTIVTGAELLEDFIKFKWGKLAQGLFSFRQRKVALMEGELNSPGNEIAYVIKSRETFQERVESDEEVVCHTCSPEE